MNVGGRKKRKNRSAMAKTRVVLVRGINQMVSRVRIVGCPILELRRDFKNLVTSSEEQYRLFSFSKVCISPELVTKFKNPLELKDRQLQPIT